MDYHFGEEPTSGKGGPVLVIEAGKADLNYWKDLWRYRELFFFLSWRDILVRYKQTVLGVAWSVLRPLITMVIFTLVFGKLAGLPSDGVPYPVLVFAAMIPWQFFANAITSSSESVVGNSSVVSKVYFPRIIIPASSIIVNLVDFAISFALLAMLMAWYGYAPSLRMLALPLFMGLAVAAALGAGLWLSALNVEYRDFRHVVPFIVQLGLYISPVGFSSSLVPEKWRLLYSLNPMVGVIDGFRWAILGTRSAVSIYQPGLVLSAALIAIVFASGLWYFRRMERTFADVI